MTTLSASPDFLDKLRRSYLSDVHWKSLYTKLTLDGAKIDSNTVEYHSYYFTKHDQLLYWLDPTDRHRKLVIPRECIHDVFRLAHNNLGHTGFAKCYQRLSGSYHIHQMYRQLKDYVSSCPTCSSLRNKDHKGGMLHPLPIPMKPLDCIAMDFVTGFPLDGEYDAILTITDKYSKMVTLIECKKTNDAEATAERIFTRYFPRFGIPSEIVSDRDVRFVSKFWRSLFKLLKVDLLMSSSFAPQTDGQSERANQTIENMLRSYIGYDLDRHWVADLSIVEFTINSQQSEASRFSPFEILYGFVPRGPWQLDTNDGTDSNFVKDQKTIRDEACQHLHWARATMARKYDADRHEVEIKIGDEVYIENRANLRIPGLVSTKTGPKRFGPFTVTELAGPGAVRVALPENYRMHDVISRRHITLSNKDEWNRMPNRPPALVQENDEGVFEVEKVLDERLYRKRKQYLIKWLGYGEHESTWVDESQSETFSEALSDYLKRRASSGRSRRHKSRTT